jgi:hypothetical protein
MNEINPGLNTHLDNIANTMGFPDGWASLCNSGSAPFITDCVQMAVNNWTIENQKNLTNEQTLELVELAFNDSRKGSFWMRGYPMFNFKDFKDWFAKTKK